MANGDAFNLQHFLDTCDASKRFVTEDEYKAGKYPQLRPNVWKEYANREPRFYASVAFSGAFGHLPVPKMQNIVTNKYGITEATKKDAKRI